MIRSMTGFARVEAQAFWGSLAWELRSVNHRYLEVGFRLPEELRTLESQFRQLAVSGLKRGKVDCSLRLKWDDSAARDLALDLELAGRVAAAAASIRDKVGGLAMPGTIDLLRWPGVVQERQQEIEPVAALAASALATALQELDAARAREGERLAAALAERCTAMTGLAEQVREHMPAIRTGLRTRLMERLAGLDLETDPLRLEQELAIQLHRMDVDEELDRLASHIAEVLRILSTDGEEANGRRLDFLMQEFNREANTLGSKSLHAETTRITVELKVLIEQMREQVQNIE